MYPLIHILVELNKFQVFIMGACNSTQADAKTLQSGDDYLPQKVELTSDSIVAVTAIEETKPKVESIFTDCDKMMGKDLFDNMIRKIIDTQLPEAGTMTKLSIREQKWKGLLPHEQDEWFQKGHDKISSLKF